MQWRKIFKWKLNKKFAKICQIEQNNQLLLIFSYNTRKQHKENEDFSPSYFSTESKMYIENIRNKSKLDYTSYPATKNLMKTILCDFCSNWIYYFSFSNLDLKKIIKLYI